MKFEETNIQGALVLIPELFEDSRGNFFESWNKRGLEDLGIEYDFVQDNHSLSTKGVLRGLHYQYNHPQGKLVRVVNGQVLDVIVDLRKNSKSFGQYFKVELSGKNKKQLWAPPGLAHGFLTLSETVDFLYKTTDYYKPDDENTIIWNDPTLNIDWELNGLKPILSNNDKMGKKFIRSKCYEFKNL